MKTPLITLAALALVCIVYAQPINLDLYSINVENEWSVNTKHSEFGMVRSSNGQYTFTSDRNKFGKRNEFLNDESYRMYTCNLDRDYRAIRPMSVGYNSGTNNGPATVVRNNTFYFTSTNKKATLNWKEGTMMNTLIVSQATLKGSKWKSKAVKTFKSKKHSFGQPTISADGSTMYLISDMEGGYGGTDIYVSRLVDGKWSAPENLGPMVNTEKNDMYPFLHESGILFFASEGHRGFGGMDIFMTAKTDGEWITPENMGNPVNTPSDDFSVYIDRSFSTGFFSSDRFGGKGGDDIYRVSFTSMDATASVPESDDTFSEAETENLPVLGATMAAAINENYADAKTALQR
ncbi:MAG: hypothetical protein GY751_08655 [Bacteroidetes bacterium]|nr:hypothetical protein [Bacteroidota bacterium]